MCIYSEGSDLTSSVILTNNYKNRWKIYLSMKSKCEMVHSESQKTSMNASRESVLLRRSDTDGKMTFNNENATSLLPATEIILTNCSQISLIINTNITPSCHKISFKMTYISFWIQSMEVAQIFLIILYLFSRGMFYHSGKTMIYVC